MPIVGEYALVASKGGHPEHPGWWDRALSTFAPYAACAPRAGRVMPVLLAWPAWTRG